MNIFEEIKSFDKRIENIRPKKNIDQAKLYSAGLSAKLNQCYFALHKLELLSVKDDHSTASTAAEVIDIYAQVAFYCDTFCVFLYSSLDVLSQIINQIHQFGMDEHQVDFKQVLKNLSTNHIGTDLHNQFLKIEKSRAFKNLHKYRNCSVHRRQIYIQEETGSIRHTPGYSVSSTGPVPKIVRTLCDDPYDIRPKIIQNRIIPDYLEDLINNIEKEIQNIIKILPEGL